MEEKSIGQNIQDLRLNKSYTIEELAMKLNIPPQVLVDWEADYGGPNGDQMMQLVNIFNVTYNELAGRVNKTTWSFQDTSIMASLVIGLFMLVGQIYGFKAQGVSFFELIGNVFQSPSLISRISLVLVVYRGIIILMTFFTIILLVSLFLSRQNPQRYKYYHNQRVLKANIALFGLSIFYVMFVVGVGLVNLNSILLAILGAVPFIFLQFMNKGV